jgi:hypothetical protein
MLGGGGGAGRELKFQRLSAEEGRASLPCTPASISPQHALSMLWGSILQPITPAAPYAQLAYD